VQFGDRIGDNIFKNVVRRDVANHLSAGVGKLAYDSARMSWISSLNSSIYVGDVHEHQDLQ